MKMPFLGQVAIQIPQPRHIASFVSTVFLILPSLTIYSITGQKVETLVDGFMSAGTHYVPFDGSNFGSGIYFYRFESKGFTKTGRMMIVK